MESIANIRTWFNKCALKRSVIAQGKLAVKKATVSNVCCGTTEIPTPPVK